MTVADANVSGHLTLRRPCCIIGVKEKGSKYIEDRKLYG